MTLSARIFRLRLRRRAAATRSPRRLWLRLHRWTGLAVGAWFVLLGLTGSILLFEEPLDRWINPELLKSPGCARSIPIEQLLAVAESHFPRAKIERLRLPASPSDVYRLRLREDAGRRVGSPRTEATFSPCDGKLLGTRPAESVGLDRARALYTVYDLHKRALLGTTGTDLVGIVGLLFLAAVVKGIYLALPRSAAGWRQVVAIKRRAGLTRVAFDVHRSTGAVLAPLLLLSIVTGVTLVYPDYARDVVSLFSRVAPFPTVPWRERNAASAPDLATIMSQVERAYPDDRVTEIRFPARAISGYLFYLRRNADVYRLGDTLVWIHPDTGELLLERSDRSRSAGETFMHWLFPLHSGTAFGTPGKIVMFAVGISPLVLLASGTYVWVRKRRASRIEDRRRGAAERPAERSGETPGPLRT
jgi:uncharacterized iron-regulated membrane protein